MQRLRVPIFAQSGGRLNRILLPGTKGKKTAGGRPDRVSTNGGKIEAGKKGTGEGSCPTTSPDGVHGPGS